MSAVAITRWGAGDLWVFDTPGDAFLHPLIQYGDPVMSRPEDLGDHYNRLDWNTLLALAGLDLYRGPPLSLGAWRNLREAQSGRIWDALLQRAQPAPTDPAEICRRITEDRRQGRMARKNKDAPVEAIPAAHPTAERGNLPPAVRGPKGIPHEAVIRFGTDKEGKPFHSQHNNPKKEGTGAHRKFSMYRDGMTVAQALDEGIPTGDLKYDSEHGYIHFEYEAAVGAAEAEAEEQYAE